MSYTEVTALWSGFTGSPGYTRMKFDGALTSSAATGCADRMRTFFNALAAELPADVVISFASAAGVYNDAQVLIDEVAVTPIPATVLGTDVAAYAGGSGAVINWLTGFFVTGRRLRGRTFLVPLAGVYFTDGTLNSTSLNAIQNAANTLLGGSPGLTVAGRNAAGSLYQSTVTGATVPDRAAVLRSRRD